MTMMDMARFDHAPGQVEQPLSGPEVGRQVRDGQEFARRLVRGSR
jgi:hypothetical protein